MRRGNVMEEEPKEAYVDAIVELVEKCHDIELLDFILQLLQKAENR